MRLTKRFFLSTLLATLLIGVGASQSMAVVAKGYGVNHNLALKNALQTAVEMVLGAHIEAQSIVEDGELIKEVMVSHAKGYVSTYKVLHETKLKEGGVEVEVDAEVRKSLVLDHADTLAILMKLAKHPRVLVMGASDTVESVPAGGEFMNSLVNTVSKVFADKFKFEVLDWSMIHAKHPEITGTLTRAKAIKNNAKFKADYLVTVSLDLPAKGKTDFALTGVNAFDNQKIGRTSKMLKLEGPLKKDVQVWEAAVKAAEADVYWQAIDLAKLMVKHIADTVQSARYSLTFLGFPEVAKATGFLEEAPGYVKHQLVRTKGKNLELSYWTKLDRAALFSMIKKKLAAQKLKFKSKLDGNVLKFKWEDPEGF